MYSDTKIEICRHSFNLFYVGNDNIFDAATVCIRMQDKSPEPTCIKEFPQGKQGEALEIITMLRAYSLASSHSCQVNFLCMPAQVRIRSRSQTRAIWAHCDSISMQLVSSRVTWSEYEMVQMERLVSSGLLYSFNSGKWINHNGYKIWCCHGETCTRKVIWCLDARAYKCRIASRCTKMKFLGCCKKYD